MTQVCWFLKLTKILIWKLVSVNKSTFYVINVRDWIFLISICALQVIAESLSEEEIAGLKEMFKALDADNSGFITFEELKVGLKRFGASLDESEIYDLMQAVSIFFRITPE